MIERIQEIQASLDRGDYRRGEWQRLVAELDALNQTDKAALSDAISKTSVKLHQRNNFPAMPFAMAYGGEWLGLIAACFLLSIDTLITAIVATGLLGLTLQPLIKITTGLLLGLRYEYAFLWYFEPRFKMRYGTYLCLPGGARIVLHLMGSIGTPIALWIGYLAISEHLVWLGYASLFGAVIAALMQVGAFLAELVGVRMAGPFRLSQLTSPATAAFELKKMRHTREQLST